MEKADVTLLNLSGLADQPILKALGKFTLRSMGGDIVRALGFKKKDQPVPESAKLAKEKRRAPLFENIQLGQPELGTMVDIDSKLKEQP
jgi:hypothetical protein